MYNKDNGWPLCSTHITIAISSAALSHYDIVVNNLASLSAISVVARVVRHNFKSFGNTYENGSIATTQLAVCDQTDNLQWQLTP